MPRTRQITILPPLGGIDRQSAWTEEAPRTSPAARNVWIVDATSGRTRVAPRPGLTAVNSPSGSPYGYCRADWVTGTTPNFTTHNGMAVNTASGAYTAEGTGTWTQQISGTPSTFSGVTVYNNYIYLANAASATAVIRRRELNGGSTEDLTADSGLGAAPLGVGIILNHADRLMCAGSVELPHAYYASGAGAPRDWLYGAQRSTGAYSSVAAPGGQIKDPIVAGVSRSNDELIWGCRRSIHTVQGNPRNARVITNSSVVGPVSNIAQCLDDDNALFFLSQAGPYVIPPGIGAKVIALGGKIPDDLVGVNPGVGDWASVGFDHRWNMVHFNVDPFSGSDVTWSYHKPTQSWWQNVYGDDTAHLCVPFQEIRTANNGAMLMISDGGTAYQFQRTSTETFDSYIWLPPFQIWDDFNDGIVAEVRAITAKFSDLWSGAYTGDMKIELYVGNSPEEAYNSTAVWSGTFNLEYLNFAQNPARVGNWGIFKIVDVSNNKWILEKLLVIAHQAGLRMVG